MIEEGRLKFTSRKPDFKTHHEQIEISEEDLQIALALSSSPNPNNEHPEDLSLNQRETDKFGSAEHITIGDMAVSKYFRTINDKKILRQLMGTGLVIREQDAKLREEVYKLSLSYTPTDESQPVLADFEPISIGQIVALAGDFYAIPHEPICFANTEGEQSARFNKVYAALVNAPKKEVEDLLDQIAAETQVIKDALAEGLSPAIELVKIENKQNKAYGTITQYTSFPGTFFYSRYVDITKTNFDHFKEDAKVAYMAGHASAILTARKAYEIYKTDQAQGLRLFTEALGKEAAAWHYLTDLFAAGHIRTPRRAIWNYVQGKNSQIKSGRTALAGLLAKEMHDEDGHHGVSVSSAESRKRTEKTTWKMLGDNCYYEEENSDNCEEIDKAVTASLDQIYRIFCFGTGLTAEEPSVLDFLPEPIGVQETYPLFIVEEGVVKVREDVNDVKCSQYISNWNPVTVLYERKTPLIKESVKQPILQAAQMVATVADTAVTAVKDMGNKVYEETALMLQTELEDLYEDKDEAEIITCKMM